MVARNVSDGVRLCSDTSATAALSASAQAVVVQVAVVNPTRYCRSNAFDSALGAGSGVQIPLSTYCLALTVWLGKKYGRVSILACLRHRYANATL